MRHNFRYFVVLTSIFIAVASLFFLHHSNVLAESNQPAEMLQSDAMVEVESTPTTTPVSCGSYCKERVPETPVPTVSGLERQIDYEEGIVKAVFFWAESCPNCLEAKTFLLPGLEKQYGPAFQIHQVELQSESEMGSLFMIGASKGLSGNQVGIPLLIIGEDILVGSAEIPARLPDLVEQYLAQGGVGYPDLPGLEDYLPRQTPTPSFTPTPTITPNTVPSLEPLPDTKTKTVINLFWGDGCPHCEVAKPFLEELARSHPQIELNMYEVWYVQENQDLFIKTAEIYGFQPGGVPTIFIGSQYWEGFNDLIQEDILTAVETCLAKGCPPKGTEVIAESNPEDSSPVAAGIDVNPGNTSASRINIPLIGTIDLSSQSLLISTLLISFVDGFNPCSIWVLTMLLALTLHTGSRKKVLLIGFIFLSVTAAVYGLFITGLFTMFKVVSFAGWIRAVVSLVALFFALVNIKDYFWYKEGVSFTISDEKKPGIFKRMRRIMDAGDSFWGLVGGTIVLAGGVSLVEFSCTAGFPVLWSNLLVSQEVTVVTFVLLLLVYLLIYQIDEMGIFLAAVLSMRASKMEEKHGRILKLIGGVLMLTLAAVMLINPNLMNDLNSSLVVFGIAFVITILILLIHRTLLPNLGIYYGSEFSRTPNSTQKRRRD